MDVKIQLEVSQAIRVNLSGKPISLFGHPEAGYMLVCQEGSGTRLLTREGSASAPGWLGEHGVLPDGRWWATVSSDSGTYFLCAGQRFGPFPGSPRVEVGDWGWSLRGEDGQDSFLVVNGREVITWGRAGAEGYGDPVWARVGRKRLGPFMDVFSVTVSPDGRHYAVVARDTGWNDLVEVDGREYRSLDPEIYFYWLPGGHWGVWGFRWRGSEGVPFLLVDGRAHGPFAGVMSDRFLITGSHWASGGELEGGGGLVIFDGEVHEYRNFGGFDTDAGGDIWWAAEDSEGWRVWRNGQAVGGPYGLDQLVGFAASSGGGGWLMVALREKGYIAITQRGQFPIRGRPTSWFVSAGSWVVLARDGRGSWWVSADGKTYGPYKFWWAEAPVVSRGSWAFVGIRAKGETWPDARVSYWLVGPGRKAGPYEAEVFGPTGSESKVPLTPEMVASAAPTASGGTWAALVSVDEGWVIEWSKGRMGPYDGVARDCERVNPNDVAYSSPCAFPGGWWVVMERDSGLVPVVNGREMGRWRGVVGRLASTPDGRLWALTVQGREGYWVLLPSGKQGPYRLASAPFVLKRGIGFWSLSRRGELCLNLVRVAP